MKTRNPSYERATAVIHGHVGRRRAGTPGPTVYDDQGNEVTAPEIQIIGATVSGEDGEVAIITIGSGTSFLPVASISAERIAGNPTFNFNCLPENVIKVSSTYYCPYIDATQDEIFFATASDRDGPWASGSVVFDIGDVPWAAGVGATHIYAPHIVENGGTFIMFYSVCDATTGLHGYIGYATAPAITGPYTDHGSPILSPGSAGQWDARRVGEPAVIFHGGQWLMAYMGEGTAAAFGYSEKLGMASAPDPSGPWTKAAINPIDWGDAGQWDSAVMADPDIFYLNGYYWMWYCAAPAIPPAPIYEGFLYAVDPLAGPWLRHPDNPILTPGDPGDWDEDMVFRGGIWIEDGEIGGTYTGSADVTTLLDKKGGNFRLTFTSTTVAEDPSAEDIPIDDVGGYFDATEVETALQELGADVASLLVGGSGHYEVIVSGTGPPVAVTNVAEDDWLYGFVPD